MQTGQSQYIFQQLTTDKNLLKPIMHVCVAMALVPYKFYIHNAKLCVAWYSEDTIHFFAFTAATGPSATAPSI